MLIIRTLAPDELADCYRLRGQIYVEEKAYLGPEVMVNGVESDQDDERSVHGGAFTKSGDLIGTFRLILRRGVPLPIEDHFGLSPQGTSAELSRLAVHPAYRTSLATIGLCRWSSDIALEQCITHVYAILERPLLMNLRILGFPFTVQGEPRQLMGGVLVPTVCVVSETVPALGQADSNREAPQLSALFIAPFTGVLRSADIGAPVERRASPLPVAST
jgi:N-acyl-L-homoserine lactone synthetase